MAALQAFLDAASNPNMWRRSRPAFENALRALPGVSVPPSLNDAAADYATASRGPAGERRRRDRRRARRAGREPGRLAGQDVRQGLQPRADRIALDRLKDAPLGPTARRLWEAAEGDIDKFRTSLEGYFDGEMRRLSGFYRRSIRVVMIGLAIIVAVACNVDAVGLARNLWRNPDGRACTRGAGRRAGHVEHGGRGDAVSRHPATRHFGQVQESARRRRRPRTP